MTRLALALTAALLLVLLPTPGRAGDAPAEKSSGEHLSLDLGCAVAKAVELGSICAELAFFKHESERRMGEELAQLLDAPARAKAVKLLDAELAEKGRKPGTKDCPAARPLCSFTDAALQALKEGLVSEK
jgi:hypothetical protein